MATLTGSTIASTYKQLLKLTTASLGADASAKYIEDGLGTDSALSISTTRVGIGVAAPGHPLHIYENTSTTSTAGVLIEQDGSGDCLLSFLTTGVQRWVTGIDSSDSAYKIAKTTNVGTDTVLTLDTSGNVGIGLSPSTSLKLPLVVLIGP